MAATARLFPPAAKPKGGVVQPPVRAVRVTKSPRAARDPRFMKVVDRLQQTTARTLRHPPAATKAAQAGAAAKAPANETLAAGKAGQVDAIQEAKTGQAAPSSFEQLLRAEIEKLMPKTLGDAEKFGQGGEKEQLKGAVSGSVNQQKDAAAAPMKEASAAAPAPAGAPKEVAAIPAEAPAAPAPVDAGAGMPTPKPQQEVSLEQSKQNADQQMQDAEVTDTQLKKANDPRFSAVLDAKSKVVAQADQAPKDYRTNEQKTLTQAAAQARGDEKGGLLALVAVKGKSAGNVKSKQQQAKEQEERDRAQVVAELEAIYAQTRDAVNRKLDSLETDAMAMFQQGADVAFENMKTFVDGRMHKYKLDRYLLKWGPTVGAGLWIKDLLVGLPDEVNQFAEEGKQRFLAEMDVLVKKVSAFVEQRLQEARDEVKRGQNAIKSHVEGLPKNLQKYGHEAEQNIQAKFDELANGIEERKNDLAQKLAEKYKAASDKADEFVTQFKESNKGLVDGFIGKLKEVVEMLKKLKERLLGLLKKGEGVIKKIIADPIAFLGNLLNAIKKGLGKFVSNIWTHLKAGFMTWLFGALAKAGIEIPSNLSLPSILKLALSVLGLTWTNIRPKIVKKIGERAVTLLEKVVELAQALFTGGPAALWAKIKEMVGDLKAMVITAIQDWLITKIIQSAIAKLVTMFNPAGAIVQAVITIYNTVMFLVDNIDSILDFVEAVLNSIEAIADGAIDGAAAWIESALAKMIPLLIGFLARLIGLGGISEKIKAFIKKVQAPIDKAIDWVIDGFFKFVKGLFKGKDKKKEDKDNQDVKAKVAQDLATRLAGQVQAGPPVQAALRACHAKFKPEGLKRLHLVEAGNHPGVFEIHAVASPGQKVGVVEAGLNLDVKDLQLEEQSFGTALTAKVNSIELGRKDSVDKNTHAEDVLLVELKANWNTYVEKLKAKKYTLSINITRSPCGRCAGRLGSFLDGKRRAGANQGYSVGMSISMVTLYGGEQQSKPGKANYVALQKLHGKGVKLKVWDVVKALEEQGVKNVGAALKKGGAKQYLEKRIAALENVLEDIKKPSAGG